MYLCYYSYPGGPTVTAPQPQPITGHIPTTEPLIITAPQPQTIAPYPLTICRKRGSDELMSHNSPMVTANGTGLSPHHTGNDMNNDAKKVKLDQNAPSRVVHIRSLPPDVTEADIVQLGIPFGKMTNVLLLKQKNQAFLEFQDESAASTMVSYHTTTPAQIRLKQVYVQFSNHKELKTDQTHSFQNATAQAALQAAQAVMVGGTGTEETRTKTTLRVIVENLVYPVTIEVLYQIFCKFGKVLKMIIFTKNNTFQALIQFGDSVSANAAKLSLDGQNIYNGCCTLRIDYSKLSNLNVKYNNDKSRDFTNPNLPSGDPALDQAMQYGDRRLVAEDMCADRFEGIYRNQQEILFGTRRKNPAVQGGYSGIADRSNIENITPPSTQRQEYYTQQKDILLASGKRKIIAPPMPMTQFGMHNAAALNVARMGMPMAPQAGSCVLLVSNLDEQKITPDALFTLFGVYGDVHRVKILFNKKDNALVQMAEPHQAQLAIAHLDKVKVWGKQIRVTQSKHAVVQMPKDGQPDAGLTKDFTNSSLHRFKRPGSKNCQNIFPPSSVLHLSNIPPSITEEELEQAFTPHGSVTGFKFFPKDRKMALIQMGSPEEAITALIAMHNYPLSDSNHLRVSFSKSTI